MVNRKLLIGDSNVIIDIIADELVDAMYMLDYEYECPVCCVGWNPGSSTRE